MIQVTSHPLLTGMLGVKYLELFTDSAPGCRDAIYVKGKPWETHQALSEPSPLAWVTQKPGFQQHVFPNKAKKLSGSISDELRSLTKRDVWKEYQKPFLHSKYTFFYVFFLKQNVFRLSETSLNKWSLMAAGGWTNPCFLPWGMGEQKNTPLNYLKKISDLSND